MMHDDGRYRPHSRETAGRGTIFRIGRACRCSRFAPPGTDNALFRLGADMAVRLPRRPAAGEQARKESRWLPLLAPHLPLDVPVPLALGMPAESYPYPWSVCRWLAGEDAADARTSICSGPQPRSRNSSPRSARSIPPAARGPGRTTPSAVCRCLARCADPGRHRELARRDRCRRGDAGLGSGARRAGLGGGADMASRRHSRGQSARPARTHLRCHRLRMPRDRRPCMRPDGGVEPPLSRNPPEVRAPACRSTMRHGRGGAAGPFSVALIALPYYLHTNPVLVGMSRRAIDGSFWPT